MTLPRRRVLRHQPEAALNPRQQRQLERRRERLAKEKTSLESWKTRLRRAFRAVDKQQARVVRLERQFAKITSAWLSPISLDRFFNKKQEVTL